MERAEKEEGEKRINSEGCCCLEENWLEGLFLR